MAAGYSKTPLGKKLGIKTGFRLLLYKAPEHYFSLFTDWPEAVRILKRSSAKRIDFIQLFCTQMKELENTLPQYQAALKKDGLLWISWPKGASKIKTDLNRDLIRSFVLKTTGLVDVKVAAIDPDWSALKFVYRLKNR